MKSTVYISIFLFSFLFSISIAQNIDKAAKAKQILDKVTQKTKTYKTLFSSFTFSMVNKTKKINEKQQGNIWVSGDKYKLELVSQTIICDGKTVWTFIKDANEVQIDNANKKDEEGKLTPKNIFTIYEKGFKYEFVKEEARKKILSQIIKLYPTEPKKKNYHTAEIAIDKVKQQIQQLVVSGKDGTISTYDILKFETNKAVTTDIFTFNKSKFPGVEILDLRD